MKQNEQIAKQVRAEYQAGLLFRHDREAAWHTIEDFYLGKAKKSLKGKFNVPIPIMPGFVEAWLGDMSKHAVINFEPTEQADYKAAKKVTALYNAHKNRDDYDWDMADTDGKKLACLTGRTIYENYGQSNPYKYNLNLVDHYDFDCDPMGGGNLEKHRFLGIDNIFLSKEDLLDGVAKKIYDASSVSKLINSTKNDVLVDNDNQFRSKQNRFTALGLNGITHNYAGQQLYKFQKRGTTFGGKRFYVLYNYETGLCIRCQPLKEVFESGLWWFTSWATNRDAHNFWNKSPCDDMVPIAEMMRVLINQELDNRNKRNYGQRMYDPDLFPNPAQLEWRQDGLVSMKSGSAAVLGDLRKGIATFETAELRGTIELTQYLDALWKEKTGVNSESQGSTDTSKVGIAYLNVQQSAKRRTLTYESYAKCWQANGRRFLWSCFEHIRKPVAVKIIGEEGEEWDEIARREIRTDWNIRLEGGEDDLAKDEIKKKQLREILATLTPDELMVTSPKIRAKVKFESGGIDEDTVRMLFDLEGDKNKEILAEASLLIQDCLANRPIKLNRGATTAFVQKIVDFATDTDLEMEEFTKLMELAEAHMPIAQENMLRKASQQRAQMGTPALPSSPPDYSQVLNQPEKQLTPYPNYAPRVGTA